MDAVLPWDDPTPLKVFFGLTMVGVVSIHLLAAEAYWTRLPFFCCCRLSRHSYAPCLSFSFFCKCWEREFKGLIASTEASRPLDSYLVNQKYNFEIDSRIPTFRLFDEPSTGWNDSYTRGGCFIYRSYSIGCSLLV